MSQEVLDALNEEKTTRQHINKMKKILIVQQTPS